MDKLKLFNGRGFGGTGHIYICATSRQHAARLYCQASQIVFNYKHTISKRQISQTAREIRDYFSPDCWGNAMEGIAAEVGLWYAKTDRDKPTKII